MNEDRIKIYTPEEIVEQIRVFEDAKFTISEMTKPFHNAIIPYHEVFKEKVPIDSPTRKRELSNRFRSYLDNFSIQCVEIPPLKTSKIAVYDTNPGARLLLAEFSDYEEFSSYAKKLFKIKEVFYLIDVLNAVGSLRTRSPVLFHETEAPFSNIH